MDLGEDVEIEVGVVVEVKSIAFSITTYGVSAAVGVVWIMLLLTSE